METHNLSAPVRSSERVLLRIPIRVEGKDACGDAFEEITHTLVVNRSGGLIVVSHVLQPGAMIRVTNIRSQISCSFEVVMQAASSLSGKPEWGVKCLEPEVEIWGVHFPPRTEEPAQAELTHVLLGCQECFSQEVAALTMPQFRTLAARSSLPRPCPKCHTTTEWKPPVMEADPEGLLPSVPACLASGPPLRHAIEKGLDELMLVKIPVEVRLPDGREENCRTENLSGSVLCFTSSLGMEPGDRVYVSMGLDPPAERRSIPASISWRRPPKGEGRALYGAKLERRV